MYPDQFNYHAPANIDEALNLLGKYGDDAKLLAGGHSLLPAMKLRLASPNHLIDMKGLRSELQYIREEGTTIAVGAMSTHHQIHSSTLLTSKAQLLAETAGHIGDVQVRNMGTIGGSLVHADPAGDFPAAVLAAEAEVVLQGPKGRRTVEAARFFHGFFETAAELDEIMVEVRVPAQIGGSSYQKFYHPASGYAICGVAVVIEGSGNTVEKCRVGITGVSDAGYRATAVEQALEGQSFSDNLADVAANHATDSIDPLEDSFAGGDYRIHLAKIYTKRALMTAWNDRFGR
jgi:carbon-monoxide dehydrogenase medium subunit